MTKLNKTVMLGAGCAMAVMAATGCADQINDPALHAQIEGKTDAIIGGVPANSQSLNAVGSLVLKADYTDPWSRATSTERSFFCTASLIGPQTVLTAKHCAQGAEEVFAAYSSRGARLAFAIGPDSQNPAREVELVSVVRAPGDLGGFVGMGRDVAVFHLAEKITDITPLTLGTLEEKQIGKNFATIGYGVQNNTGTAGTRFAGTETLRGLQGSTFELMFGSFEAFREWVGWYFGNVFFEGKKEDAFSQTVGRVDLAKLLNRSHEEGEASEVEADGEIESQADAGDAGVDPTPSDDAGGGGDSDLDQIAQYWWDTTYLLEGYEAYTGGASGNTQSCYGDSGSPLVREVNGKLRAFGVVSGGLPSQASVCGYGTVFASFGPEVMAFLNAEKKWIDPCKGTPTSGVCDKRAVKRCTKPDEGERRLVRIDCGLLGQTCGTDESGAAVCVDPTP